MKFIFSSPFAQYPATYLWKCYPKSQANYYTILFWGNHGTFTWYPPGWGKSYYGFHPFPDPSPNGTRYWEIAADGGDYTNSRTTPVQYERWYTQVARVWDDGSYKRHEYYWNYPNTSNVLSLNCTRDYGTTPPPSPCISVGDCPWPHLDGPPPTGEGTEVFFGYLRGFQFYNYQLSTAQMALVAQLDTDAQVLAACRDNGMALPWYLNMNPSPSDISDKSGRGNNPAWVGAERPTLWSA